MTYLYDFLMFLAQAVTIVAAICVVLSVLASISARRRHTPEGALEVMRFNDYLDNLRHGLEQAMLTPGQYRKAARREAKARAKQAKQEAKMMRQAAKDGAATSPAADEAGGAAGGDEAQGGSAQGEIQTESQADGRPEPAQGEAQAEGQPELAQGEAQAESQEEAQGKARSELAEVGANAEVAPKQVALGQEAAGKACRSRVYALNFEGDLDASKVSHLRHEINAVLAKAEDGDEVLVRVKSFGGRVHSYGLAASQLQRVRERGLNLVVAVDQVAASGGYLMAAVANRVIAAPFALVGSIGVVAEIPNIHRLLKKHDVDVETITAGRYKRTLTLLGENTEEGRRKLTEELQDVHVLFQEFVAEKRPQVELEKVATGEAWYGRQAIKLKLVDEIMTSDAYLMARCREADVFEVRWVEHKKPVDRLLAQVETGIRRLFHWTPGA